MVFVKGDLPMIWQLFNNHKFEDYEQLREHIRGWELDFRQLKPGTSPADLLQFGRPDFLVTRFDTHQAYDQRGAAARDAVTLAVLEDGMEEVLCPRGSFNQDGMMYFPPGHDLNAVSRSRFKGYTLTISEALIDEVCSQSGIPDPFSSKLLEQMPVHSGPERMDALRKELRKTCQSFISEKPGIRNDQTTTQLEFELVRQLIATISGADAPNPLRMSKRKIIVINRALEYINSNINRNITVLELAHASGSSVRTLEYVFRDYFGVTPKAYLKARRLHGVRKALLEAGPGQTVHMMAGRWGFWHMGQFAADYKRFFGELPSETMNLA